MNNKKLLGQRIKEVRKSNGLTQEKLAESIGIETGSLSAIESGRHFPSLITLEKIAKQFNVQMQVFFEFHSTMTEEEMKEKLIENLEKMKKKNLTYLLKMTEYYKTLS